MKMENKIVVVTGASSGIGKAIVELFVKEGANVIAVARRKERLEQLAEDLEECPGTVLPFPADITSNENNEAMVQFAVEKFGRLDVLVNNAGIGDDVSPVGDLSDELIARVMGINLYAPIYGMRAAIKQFEKQETGGSIVNIASISGLRTVAGAIYGGSKAALISISKNTAFMYMPKHIRCNVICPGGVETEIAATMGVVNQFGWDRVSGVMAIAPKPGQPEQIANAALFLASDDSSYVNGDVMVVDGGWIAG